MFIGSALYGILMSYLMWLLFYWLTPIVMSLSWGWFVVYLFVAGGFVSLLIANVTYLLSVPWGYLVQKSKLARYAPIPFLLFFGYSAIKLPWSFGSNWGALQWMLGLSLTVIILISFISLLSLAFKMKNDN